MPRWQKIVIHHSLTTDTLLTDTVGIRRFHTSYRQYGDIITKDTYEEKENLGESGLVKPWSFVGYHWLVETQIRNFSFKRIS